MLPGDCDAASNDAHGYQVNGVTADSEGDVHVDLKCLSSNDSAQGMEQGPVVGNIQRHQLTGGLNIRDDDKILKNGLMIRILWIFVHAEAADSERSSFANLRAAANLEISLMESGYHGWR